MNRHGEKADYIFSNNERKRVVFQIQNWLKVLSADGMAIPSVVPDGVYGIKTAQAVSVFQGIIGMPQNGNVNFATWTALKAAYENVVKKRSSANPIYPFEYTLKDDRILKGENVVLIHIVQAMIETLAVVYDGIGHQDITGILDSQTSENLAYLQEIWNLPVTGELDTETWNSLADAYNGSINRE